jgi:hypothetical protein
MILVLNYSSNRLLVNLEDNFLNVKTFSIYLPLLSNPSWEQLNYKNDTVNDPLSYFRGYHMNPITTLKIKEMLIDNVSLLLCIYIIISWINLYVNDYVQKTGGDITSSLIHNLNFVNARF